MPIITLTTDFGQADTYVGQMKGVIFARCPGAAIVDLTHQVPPQDVVAGALLIDSALDAFEAGTVHVGVVDPGVGSDRRAVALQVEGAKFVGPDNGLFDLALRRRTLERAVAIENTDLLREPISSTFHGRDVFAPAAAHLARGGALDELGPALDALVPLDVPDVQAFSGGLIAHVLHIDHFGNLITNLTATALLDWAGSLDAALIIEAGHARIEGLSRTFADVAPGEPVAYIGSGGRLEVAVRGGSAEAVLGARSGGMIHVRKLA